MPSPEIELERYLQEKKLRHEQDYDHILGRLLVENLPPNHLHHWLVKWMNVQLSDIGVKSSGRQVLPRLHFDLVRVQRREAAAHIFAADEFTFIVVTEPMVDEMLALSTRLVDQNRVFMSVQIAPSATFVDIAHFLVFLQFCLVTSHEYSHLVRRHLADQQPYATELGEALVQSQEFDADGYAIYHELTYLFHGDGRAFTSNWLKIKNPKALENTILDCFLIAIMIQYCARWAGKMQVDSDFASEHPPTPMRIDNALLITEMWCREIGGRPTAWLTDGTLQQYFSAAARLFPAQAKLSWNEMMRWLKSQESEEYRERIRSSTERIRTSEI